MWENILELQQRLHDLKAEGRTIVDAAKGANRAFTDDENEKLDAIQAQVRDLETEIAAVEEANALERAFAPDAVIENLQGAAPAIQILPDSTPNVDPAARCGFTSLADFALSVHGASRQGSRADARLEAAMSYMAAPTNFHQEQGSTEGYQVPPAFRDEVWSLVFGEGDDLLNMVSPEPTSSNSVGLLADESTPWGASGIVAKWRSEGTQMDPTTIDTKGRQVNLHQLYAFVLATEELLEDSPRLNNRLTTQAARAIRWKASDAIAYGNGAGQPMGYMNSTALVTVGKESAQVADTIVAMNVAKMYSRMLPDGLARATWLANSDVVPQLMTMTLGDQPIWTPPASGFVSAPGGFLLGRPVRLTDHARTLGDKGDIQFVDPMGYYAATKANGITFANSIHLYFDYNIQAFRWTFRMGGQPFLSAPVDPANGSNTKSHFVTLAERA